MRLKSFSRIGPVATVWEALLWSGTESRAWQLLRQIWQGDFLVVSANIHSKKTETAKQKVGERFRPVSRTILRDARDTTAVVIDRPFQRFLT